MLIMVFQKSAIPLYIKLSQVVLIGALMIASTQVALRLIDNALPVSTSVLTTLAFIIMVVIVLVSGLVAYRNFTAFKYEIDGGVIKVQRRRFLEYEDYARHDLGTVDAVNLRQTFLGRQMDYGDIQIRFNYVGSTQLELKYLTQPKAALALFDTAHVTMKSKGV
jgi:uncharacterized membrane protein YdbT with pleckstrin-like domain